MTDPLTWGTKDPDEVLDYTVDWTTRLDGDTISSSQWTLSSGISQGATSNTDTTTTIWISGGTAGTTARITNRVTTAGGRTMEETVTLVIQSR